MGEHHNHTHRFCQNFKKMGSWPEDVGILAIHVVVPATYVHQTDLEVYNNVSAGKYTIGLGQEKMGFCTDLEDVNSICLTAFSQLMIKTGTSYNDIGRLEVGTESLIDKSKSVKSVLMQLFKDSGNHNVEGIDNVNACYGATSAFLNCLNWVESGAWDGRLAAVVGGDIAVYAEGSARPTGGAGAFAMLIGPNAPIVIDRGLRASYMDHAYDFYKANLSTIYPLIDGQLSIKCYLNALDNCYQSYCQKAKKFSGLTGESNDAVGLNSFDAMIFHAPFGKLVEKSLARLVLNDFLNTPKERVPELYPGLENFVDTKLEESYFDKNIEKSFMNFSKSLFKKKTQPSLLLSNQVGNMYTASLYGGLLSHLANNSIEDLEGQRIGFFSYGSGLASTMYSAKLVAGPKLTKLVTDVKYIHDMLDNRKKVDPLEYNKILDHRDQIHNLAPYTPSSSIDRLFPNTWYLSHVDQQFRRSYKLKT